MNPTVFKKLRDIVYEQSGINIKEGKMSMVSARINKRLRELQMADEAAYLAHLEKSADELVELLNVISTNVTHFYREAAHFDFLKKVMSDWAKEGQARFRLWCAAASTGEEPYTIAITLTETFTGTSRRPDMRLLASDISTRVLDQCQKGVYRSDQMTNVPERIKSRYFKKKNISDSDYEYYEVREDLKKMILFKRINLNTPPFPMKGPLDVVFCRNVMIYFDKQTKARLLKDVYRLLKPGGYLFVSHTESLAGIQHEFHHAAPSVYQKSDD